LYADGSTEEELADMIGVHPVRMPAILELAMKEIPARERERAAAVIRPELELLESAIAENVLIVVTRCPACGGDEQARISCRKCARWTRTAYGPTGYAYAPTRRTAALGRINRLAWRRIKLLRLDKRPPTSSTGEPLAPKHRSPPADYLERKLNKELARLEREEGITPGQIAAKAGASRQRVDQIINATPEGAPERTDELAEFALERELLLTKALIREAAQILLRKCEWCEGDETQRTKCTTCARTGYVYRPDTRLRAIDRIADARDHRIKLLGQDREPPPRPGSDPGMGAFFEMLQKASDEELAAELEKLEAAQQVSR